VAYTCNPSSSGGRDQADYGSKLTPGKYFTRPYLEKSLHRKWLVEWLKVKVLSSNSSTTHTHTKSQVLPFPICYSSHAFQLSKQYALNINQNIGNQFYPTLILTKYKWQHLKKASKVFVLLQKIVFFFGLR
jgi:hypothetical protein